MADLKSVLTDPSRRQAVIRDCEGLVESEVRAKSGLTGLAVKGAYKIVTGVKPGMIPDAIDGLLDDFSVRLDPFYQAHGTQGGGRSLADYFASRRSEIADALLGITDERARRTRHTTLKKAYEGLRPQGKKHVEEAVPGIGRLVEKYVRP